MIVELAKLRQRLHHDHDANAVSGHKANRRLNRT
jgi:hypothetical protein